MFEYDRNSPESILAYAKHLEGMTFLDVLKMYCEHEGIPLDSGQYKDTAAKGQLGNFLEKHYFGYDSNGNQEADFKESGVELKQTCIDIKKDGSFTAGERLSVTNISYNDPVEPDFNKSHVWEKIRRMLLVHYIRNKSVNRMLYEIRFVNLFTPPKEDLDIIIEDYKKIIGKLMEGKAHEISESDTLYLGACTKGATAEKSTKPQYYGDHTPARKRNFCLKRQYMDYVLHQYVLKDAVPYERVITEDLGEKSFEDIILERIQKHIGESDRQLCALYDREYNNNKAQWVDLSYRMLGIKGNHAEEFEKANIVVKAIRLEENGKMKESMSFPPFRFCDFVKQEWEDSDIYEYFSETKFLFVVFKKKGTEYLLRGTKFWNMPTSDLDGDVREGWENVKNTIEQGVKFTINRNGTVSNNLPDKKDNRVIHVRPHAQKAAYDLGNGFVRGNVERDANPLPDGRWMTTQSFWINNDYIMEQLMDIDIVVKKNDNLGITPTLTPDEVLNRLFSYYDLPDYALRTDHQNHKSMRELMTHFRAYDSKGRRLRKEDDYLCMHKTPIGEKIIFGYDGRELIDLEGRGTYVPSPSVICQDKSKINEITIKDIWDLIYRASEIDMALVACIVLVFFHLRYETHHKNTVTKLYVGDVILEDEKDYFWNLPCFDDEIMDAFNTLIGDIIIGDFGQISFEAFIYYWELEFIITEYAFRLPIENRAAHLKYRKRIRVFDQVVAIAEYFMGIKSYGEILEIIDKGDVERKNKFTRISAVTKGAVHSKVKDLFDALKESGVTYIESARVATQDGSVLTIAAIPDARIVVPWNEHPEKIKLFKDNGWEVVLMSDIHDQRSLEEKVQFIRSNIR